MLSSAINLSLLSLIVTTTATPLAPRNVAEHEILLWGRDGRVEIMDKAEYITRSNIPRGPPASITDAFLQTTASVTNNAAEALAAASSSALQKRGCKSHDILVLDPVQKFLNWDVPMSTVVTAGDTDASVSVTEGYQITNSVDITASLTVWNPSLTVSAGLAVDFGESWTSSYTAGYTFTVPAGKYGAVVSNPAVTRNTGVVQRGMFLFDASFT